MSAWEGYHDEKKIERLQTFYLAQAWGGGFRKPEEMYWIPGDPLPPRQKTKEEREAMRKLAKQKWKAPV